MDTEFDDEAFRLMCGLARDYCNRGMKLAADSPEFHALNFGQQKTRRSESALAVPISRLFQQVANVILTAEHHVLCGARNIVCFHA
jgi:hypothetical protein